MKKVGRPRKPSAEKKEIISVNLTASLIQKLNHDLSWSQSRSEWIERAVKEKLHIVSDAAQQL
jgi:metal-responsive CopG/Arc/MetJ family transcriptional regulator